MVDIIIIMKIR